MPSVLPLLAAIASMHSIDVPATFGDKIDKAAAKSGIAVLLPQHIPSEFAKLYPDESASKGTYSLDLGAVRHCFGATACGAAYFGGSHGGKPSGEVRVKLARGHHGFFTPTHCGGSCAPPEVTWKQGGNVYFVQIKGLSAKQEKRVTRRAADSAIRHGARASAAEVRTVDVPDTVGAHNIDVATSSSLIAVLLPQTVQTDAKRLFPDVTADPGKWTILLDLTKDCHGAGPCDYARFVGKHGGKLRGRHKVHLNGRTGRFTPSHCGANCSLAEIRFKFRKNLYRIASPDPRAVLIDLANSALEHGPR